MNGCPNCRAHRRCAECIHRSWDERWDAYLRDLRDKPRNELRLIVEHHQPEAS